MDKVDLPEQDAGQKLLTDCFPTLENLFFIQIGSNDGQTLDPIHEYIKKYHWQGILVEPVPHLFKTLLRTYEGFEGLYFENAAIDHRDGSRAFYQLRETADPDVPFWYNLLGSFSREVIYKHKDEIPGFEEHLIIEDVKCISFRTLIEKHHVDKVDIIQIDTEGYDYEIIKLILQTVLRPRVFLFEHVHLSPGDFLQCKELLTRNGYEITEHTNDTIACL